MLLFDDALLWIFREVHQAAQQELANEGEAITAKLSELYMMLESGQITEEQFDVQEQLLLDRLDQWKYDTGLTDPGEENQEIAKERRG